jgi:translin
MIIEGLSETAAAVSKRMSIIESKRERSIAMSRSLIRDTKHVMHAIYAGEDHRKLLNDLDTEMRDLISETRDDPEVFFSASVQDAMMEYAETSIFASIIRPQNVTSIPSFEELGITPQSWAMGLADAVGELRRSVLNALIKDDLELARYYFSCMESMSDEVLMFDIPDAVLPIRRKQDIIRGVMERTRSDIANAIIIDRKK